MAREGDNGEEGEPSVAILGLSLPAQRETEHMSLWRTAAGEWPGSMRARWGRTSAGRRVREDGWKASTAARGPEGQRAQGPMGANETNETNEANGCPRAAEG